MLRKYATATIIGAEIARPGGGLIKSAHRAVFDYKPRPGFLYVRSRMISSRCNDNHDEFPAEEIRAAWKTAIGKPAFVNHHNEDHRRMRGVIIDAALHEDTLPDGKPDVWIEALHEIDAQRFPKLAKAIIEGRVNRTSMGTDVGFSVCSACGNKASTPAEYCQHIPKMKGKILYRHTASGKREGHLIREICYKLGFFENSFLVEDPADPTAVVTGVDDRGLKVTASKQAVTRNPTYGGTHCLVCGEHVKYYPKAAQEGRKGGGWSHHDGMKRDHLALPANPEGVIDSIPAQDAQFDQDMKAVRNQLGMPPRHDPNMPPDPFKTTSSLPKLAGWFKRKPVDWQIDPDRKVDDLNNGFHLIHHLAEEHGWDGDAFQSAGQEGFRKAHDRLHREGVPGMTDDDGMHFHGMKSSLPSAEAVRYDKATDHPFFKDTHLSPKHIVAAYDEADGETKAQGMRWYSDAHHIAKSLDPDGDAHRGAGVLAAYSPRTAWPVNLFNASHTLRNRRAVRIGEGMNVMGMHAKSAGKIVEDGHHYFQVFKTPKITDFAHLIAHGGDDQDCKMCEPHRQAGYPKRAVVVDRHALSVAAGRRMTDNDIGRAPLGTRKFYEHVADQYREAADQISDRDGTVVHPHQVQAITWLQQQKRNTAADSGESFGGRGRITRDRNAWHSWEEHAKHQHPGLMDDEGNIHVRNPHRKSSSLPTLAFRKGAPFAGYDDFEDCKEKNAEKDDPDAFCGEIKHRVEGSLSSLPKLAISDKEMHKQADYRGTLYHGTDAAGARGIMRNGLQEKSYLTPDADGARMFAQSTAGCYDWADENDDHPDECPHEDHEPPVVLAIHGIEGEGLKKDYPEVTAENLGHHTHVDAGDYVMNYHRVPSERITRQSSLPSVLAYNETKAPQDGGQAGRSHRLADHAPSGDCGRGSSLPRVAYGEVKAPQDVDTLRAESCPVCGETDAFDGDRCQVCNFLQPPTMFTDPDTGVARQMDLRKDVMDQQQQVGPDGQPLPGQEGVDPNDPNGQDPAMEGLPGQAGDQIADLFCPACGFSADTQEPMTNNDPSMPSEQQGLMEGDLCPNCEQATMLSPNDVGAMGGEVPQEIADDADADGMPDDMEPDENQDGVPDDAEEQDDLADAEGDPEDPGEGETDQGIAGGDSGDGGLDEGDQEDEAPPSDAVEDEDEAPKGRKDNTRRAARRG